MFDWIGWHDVAPNHGIGLATMIVCLPLFRVWSDSPCEVIGSGIRYKVAPSHGDRVSYYDRVCAPVPSVVGFTL